MLDEATSQPVPGAAVTLLDSAGNALKAMMADTAGRFAVPVVRGEYAFSVRRIGYEAFVTERFRVPDGAATVSVTILVTPVTVELDTVTVIGERPKPVPPRLQDFYERRARGWGYFMTRQEIEQRGAVRVTQLLSMAPRVRIVKLPALYKDEGKLIPGRTAHYTLRIIGKPPGCVPLLYIDGINLGPVDDVDERGVDVLVFVHELEGVEVYRSAAELPAEFGGSDSMCGVIVLWTRRSP